MQLPSDNSAEFERMCLRFPIDKYLRPDPQFDLLHLVDDINDKESEEDMWELCSCPGQMETVTFSCQCVSHVPTVSEAGEVAYWDVKDKFYGQRGVVIGTSQHDGQDCFLFRFGNNGKYHCTRDSLCAEYPKARKKRARAQHRSVFQAIAAEHGEQAYEVEHDDNGRRQTELPTVAQRSIIGSQSQGKGRWYGKQQFACRTARRRRRMIVRKQKQEHTLRELEDFICQFDTASDTMMLMTFWYHLFPRSQRIFVPKACPADSDVSRVATHEALHSHGAETQCDGPTPEPQLSSSDTMTVHQIKAAAVLSLLRGRGEFLGDMAGMWHNQSCADLEAQCWAFAQEVMGNASLDGGEQTCRSEGGLRSALMWANDTVSEIIEVHLTDSLGSDDLSHNELGPAENSPRLTVEQVKAACILSAVHATMEYQAGGIHDLPIMSCSNLEAHCLAFARDVCVIPESEPTACHPSSFGSSRAALPKIIVDEELPHSVPHPDAASDALILDAQHFHAMPADPIADEEDCEEMQCDELPHGLAEGTETQCDGHTPDTQLPKVCPADSEVSRLAT